MSGTGEGVEENFMFPIREKGEERLSKIIALK